MTIVSRVSAKNAKKKVDENQSLLVCIYDDDKFKSQAHLEGAIPMSEFLKLKPDLSKDTSIIFY